MPEFSASLPEPCPCDSVELRQRALRNDTLRFVEQCLVCGREVRSFKKQDLLRQGKFPNRLPAWDDEIQKRYWEWRNRAFEQKREAESEAFWERHSEHMKSAKWRLLRVKVFRRCNNICEGCGDRQAVQVHHLSYRHLGDELLFELAAVCLECHEKIHGHPTTDD